MKRYSIHYTSNAGVSHKLYVDAYSEGSVLARLPDIKELHYIRAI